MNDRKTSIQKLASLIEIDRSKGTIEMGGWRCYLLSNHYIDNSPLYQVYECVSSGKEHLLEPHVHEDNKEIFYQVKGTSTFNDGTVLKSGETKTILPGIPHDVILSKDGVCICIVHPPVEEYKI